MELWYSEPKKNLVDAIEEGKIVRVTEEYARKENLPVLRKHKKPDEKKQKKEEEDSSILDLKKNLYYKKNQVLGELLSNFNWHIVKKRRDLNLTRRQLAEKLGESENTIKLLENGILPKEDFVVINKLQDILGLNLRKDKQDFTQSPRTLIQEPTPIKFNESPQIVKNEVKEKIEKKEDVKEAKGRMLGDDIELLE